MTDLDALAVLAGCDETPTCPGSVHTSRCWRSYGATTDGREHLPLLTSRENQVLAEFRRESEALGSRYPEDWLRACTRDFWEDRVPEGTLAHARTVLTRLVALGRQGAEYRHGAATSLTLCGDAS